MHGLKSAGSASSSGLQPLVFFFVYTLLLLATPASAAVFKVEHAQTRLVEGVYVLDADCELRFSEAALQALENGVPLTVTFDIQVLRRRALLWDERIAKIQARQQLQVHPLSSQYLLKNLNSGVTRTFRTLEEATAALGTVRDFPLIDNHLLEGDQDYALRLRASLDIEALPAPLRLLAYLSSLWRLTSGWQTWPIQR